jgi:hypothetical protein
MEAEQDKRADRRHDRRLLDQEHVLEAFGSLITGGIRLFSMDETAAAKK